MDLSIPIPKSNSKKVSLENCLETFIADESMEKCGYKCSKCKKEDTCNK